MKNIFTVDLEEYYSCNLGENSVNHNDYPISTIEKNTNKLLELFDKFDVKATFFVLATIGETHPELIKKIADKGHEIASHGYGHELIYEIGPDAFINDIKKAKEIIEHIIEKPIIGYRAPSWSITKKSLWALNILEKNNFKYSSSIFPIKTFLYGIPEASKEPNYPIINNSKLNILEIPPSTNNFYIKNLGFSGGFYFRFFPFFIIKNIIKKMNKKKIPVVCYIHPWEIDTDSPKLNLKGIDKFIHYYGIKKCYKKLEKLLSLYEFTSIEEVYFK